MKVSQKVLLKALELSNDGFMLSDGVGNILYFNEAYSNLTLFDKKIVLGTNIKDYVVSGYIKNSACIRAIQEKKLILLTHFYPNRTAVFVASKPILDENGNVVNVITNLRDITEYTNLKDDIENVEKMLERFSEENKNYSGSYGDNVIAVSEKIKNVYHLAHEISKVDTTVLILGESGVGKEVLAKYIHENSKRKNAQLLAINCGAIPENLLESELFGYSAGTFTGGLKQGKDGLLKAADGGTLLLDEIGDMPLTLQVKMLRVLENKKFTPVGGNKEISSDVRILSATNKDLKEMIKKGEFREDLFYRLNVINITIPPLRERIDDIVPLSIYFLKYFNEKYKLNKVITPRVLNKLKYMEWNGNVRELKNTIEMMTILSKGKELEFIEEKHNYDINILENYDEDIGDLTLEEFMNETEKKFLEKARRKYKTTRKMAEALNVNHSTVIRKLQKHGINENRNKN